MLKSSIDLINILNTYPSDDSVYLVEKLNENTGFFVKNKKCLYLSIGNEIKNSAIKTEYLNLFTNVFVSPISEYAQFKEGNYNILEFNRDVSDELFETFINLCRVHADNLKDVSFNDFFYALVNLFQIPPEQKYKNLIGFYGELQFIKYCINKGINVAEFWHKNSFSYSKYDFIFNNFNIEIKTIITEEKIVKIKHNQIFNSDKNFLVVIQLEKSNAGSSLNDLLDIFKRNDLLKNNYEFWIKVEQEKNRISKTSSIEEKFSFRDISVYFNNDINPMQEISELLTEIQYNYDLTSIKEYGIDKLIGHIK